ncbi:MAG: DUF2806 domain-containing protein [Chloroflexi bacterium]|nr:DUF2806 domain-containing protein [Chloroflexota bacterium]
MDWLGEKLVLRLWRTAEKGLGGLLKPWQIRRTGAAQIDVERMRRLVAAKTALDVDAILSGQDRLADDRQLLENTTPEAGLLPEAAIVSAQRALLREELHSQRNVAKALLAAEAELRDDEAEPPDRDVDDDWFFRWRQLTGGVSSEELQTLWGRVLAGEVKSPGSFSLRTLDFLKNLSRDEAETIETVAKFVLDGSFIAWEAITEPAASFSQFLLLGDMGVISPPNNMIVKRFKSLDQDRFIHVFTSYGRALAVEHEDPQRELVLKSYLLTAVGREIHRLIAPSPNEDYLRKVADLLKSHGFNISLGRFVRETEETIRYFDSVEL